MAFDWLVLINLPVEKINEMPSWYFTIPSWIPTSIGWIEFAKQLHSHHSKYENDDK